MTGDQAESPALTPDELARRAASFGGVASHYERYRPGPPMAAVDWMVPAGARTVVDLGAGTGALTRLLVGRVPDVVAVEPDDRMRAVLTEAVPSARAVAGRGESMPLPDASADAVIASSSWHWMDVVPALTEVARVLVPRGVLGAVWSGPDPESPLIADAASAMTALGMAGEGGDATADGAAGTAGVAQMVNDSVADRQTLVIPPGVPFEQPESTEITWDQALTADDLVGLLGTLSVVILMDEDARNGLFDLARAYMAQEGIEGDTTVDVGFRAGVWKARRHS
jgi:SAM-dependent methyltransferase